jgi:haloalkane dehalogenase
MREFASDARGIRAGAAPFALARRRFLRGFAAAGAAALAGCLSSRDPTRSMRDVPELDARAYHDARRFTTVAAADIAWVERGQGEVALFLHGFPLNGFQWRGVLPRLAPLRRCIAVDLPGLGFTRMRDGQSLDPDAQVAMLRELLDVLGIARVDLVASDSGGAIAQLLLARHPERVRSLLLTNCDTEIDSPPPALQPVIELAREGRFVDTWLGPWFDDPVLARSPEGIGGMCYADPRHPTDEAIEMYFGPLLSTRVRTAAADAYAVALARNALLGTEALLRRTRAPARIVWGTADPIFSAESPAYLARVLGGSQGVRRLEGQKLFWPEELPDIVAAEARALWAADGVSR